MTTKRSTSTTLVIVESPAKCKKIEGFLGPGYRCVASFGHLRELPSLKHIDVENGFAPTFEIADSKRKHVNSLKKEISHARDVVLATDDDREGEAIAWHICMLFGLDVHTTKRIIFHEITEAAVQAAMRSPVKVNMNVVHAQQTRQILDLVLGFRVSPVLWKHVAHAGLSAGRCQTPALKLIYENQEEIKGSVGRCVYTTAGLFRIHTCIVPFEWNKEHTASEDLLHFYEQTKQFRHEYSCTSPKKVCRAPPMPLSTSRLQQTASNELRYSPKDTMRLCQSLYEAGYITYMRTDSKKYAKAFLSDASIYITQTFGEPYLSSNQALQDITNDQATPHEAIRPTNISVGAEDLPETCTSKEVRLYKLIRNITLQSCMAPAELYSIKATITAPDGHYTHKSESMCFPGWMSAGSSSKPDIDEKTYKVLLASPPTNVNFTSIVSKMTMKDIKQHYTEAKLVQLLEERGIGRPSTFSAIIDKIQERGYVKKQNVTGQSVVCKDYEMLPDLTISSTSTTREFGNENGKLVIQATGVIVMEFLEKHFAPLFQYEYTKRMEDSLDTIASPTNGNTHPDWTRVAEEYYGQISDLLTSLDTDKASQGKVAYKIDGDHEYIIGKNGPVVKCTSGENVSFKPTNPDLDLRKLENGEYSLEEVVAAETKDGINLGEHNGHSVVVKKGRFGLYAKWGTDNVSLKTLGNRPIENVHLEDVVQIIATTSSGTRILSDDLSIRPGKRGPYLFHKSKAMKKPAFLSLKDCPFDFMTCEADALKQWIYDVHKV